MIFEEQIGKSYQIFKPGSSKSIFQMSSIYKGAYKTNHSLNSKEWKSQSSLEWLFGSIKKIDISIYQEWNHLFLSILVKFQTVKSELFLCKEWNCNLFKVKFSIFSQSVPSVQSLSIEVCLNLINIKENHPKGIVLTEHCEKIENFTLKKKKLNFTLCRVKIHSLQFEILPVWRKISDFHS